MTRSIPALLALCALAPVWSQTGSFADVNGGARIYYEVTGQGEPLLLIHGFGNSGAAWNPVKESLSAKFRLIVVDMRGHGRSTNPAKTFTHRQSAQDMFGVLDKLGLKTCKAMGISSGGMTLLHMATQQPDRIESMALIGATIYFPEQARAIMRKTDPGNIPPEAMERDRRQHAGGDEQIRQLRTNFRDFKDSYEDMNFTGPLLSTIRARTLIIHGDRDQFFPVNIPVEMYRSIPRSYLWIIPNGGHVPVFSSGKRLSHQEAFVATAIDFFSGNWDR
jgi:pimeloyl-ACP methyl ester carboxylesterase